MRDEIKRLRRKEVRLRAKAKALDAHIGVLRRRSLRWWTVVRSLEERRLGLEKKLFMQENDVRVPVKMAPARKRKKSKASLERLWKQVMGDTPMPGKEE